MTFLFGSQEQKPFIELQEFPQLNWLKGQHQIIVEELKRNRIWMNWGSDDYDPSGHCQFLSGDWTVCPVYFGSVNPYQINAPGVEKENIDALVASLPNRFPKTIELLKNVSSLRFAAFSRLHPRSNLAPHRHVNPLSYIFHLGLIIPPGNTCGLKVGDQTHLWTKPGDAVIFNDNFEHSAWNHSDEERIILYIDFSRF